MLRAPSSVNTIKYSISLFEENSHVDSIKHFSGNKANKTEEVHDYNKPV